MRENQERTKEKIEELQKHVEDLLSIVNALEVENPGRPFTLDGHLIGSIGEVMAQHIYGIKLETPGKKTYDGIVDGKKVQIKITQQDRIIIHDEPTYLIALFMRKDGRIFEVYNGPGEPVWNSATQFGLNGYRHTTVLKLMRLQEENGDADCILAKYHIEKMKKEYRNKK